MTEEQKKAFIGKIAPHVVKIAPEFGIAVNSPVIAQAILESGWGTTDKALRNNFFGLKYQENRVPSASGSFSSSSYEQLPNGTYYPIVTLWCAFDSVESGVRGYFEFINTSRYQNVKHVTDPETYLTNLRADGYATSLDYVKNLMKVISSNNLTEYDRTAAAGSASSTVPYVFKTNYAAKGNYGGMRNVSDIRFIAIHYTANDGDTDEGNGNYFKSKIVKASAHYFVDDDSVTQSVPDEYIAWSVGGKKYSDCPSTGGGTMYGVATNANTINVEICDTVKDGTVYPTEKTIQNTLYLVKSLMQRYGIPASRVIRHFDVTGKKCPAYWVDENRWRKEFLDRLTNTGTESSSQIKDSTSVSGNTLYRVQVGAYKSKANAVLQQKKLRQAGFDTFLFEKDGYYKIQCGAYSSKANAEQQKAKIMSKGFAAIVV